MLPGHKQHFDFNHARSDMFLWLSALFVCRARVGSTAAGTRDLETVVKPLLKHYPRSRIATHSPTASKGGSHRLTAHSGARCDIGGPRTPPVPPQRKRQN